MAEFRLVERQEDFDRLIERLWGEPLVALDTEAASFHRYRDRVYLLQLSSRTQTWIVDPLGVENIDALGPLLESPEIEIVLHDADYDLRLLDLERGFRARKLFDTRIAAQLLNEPGVGLAALLEKHLGVKLDKKYQRADWSARPLTDGMLRYAADDTRHLPQLRDILREQLRARGRLDWAEEEFELVTGVRYTAGDNVEPPFLRLKGAKALKPRQLGVLRELVQWRDSVAERLDRATFRVLNNEPMLLMAKAPPNDAAALAAIQGVSSAQVERYGREILAAVQRGVGLPDHDLPRVERLPRRPPDPAFEARLERLKTTRNSLAVQYDLQPGVLCPNHILEAIARTNPTRVEELAIIPVFGGGRFGELGGALIGASNAKREGEQS